MLLVCLVAVPAPGYTYDLVSADFPFAVPDQARLPTARWIRLAVDVEDYYPTSSGRTGSETVHAQAILPELLLQVPDMPFQPYVGMGVGLSFNRSFAEMALSPSLARLQESLITHIGGGFVYHLGESVSLLGGVRYAQFKSTGVLSSLGLSPDEPTDDFSTYTVEFGIRVPLRPTKP